MSTQARFALLLLVVVLGGCSVHRGGALSSLTAEQKILLPKGAYEEHLYPDLIMYEAFRSEADQGYDEVPSDTPMSVSSAKKTRNLDAFTVIEETQMEMCYSELKLCYRTAKTGVLFIRGQADYAIPVDPYRLDRFGDVLLHQSSVQNLYSAFLVAADLGTVTAICGVNGDVGSRTWSNFLKVGGSVTYHERPAVTAMVARLADGQEYLSYQAIDRALQDLAAMYSVDMSCPMPEQDREEVLAAAQRGRELKAFVIAK